MSKVQMFILIFIGGAIVLFQNCAPKQFSESNKTELLSQSTVEEIIECQFNGQTVKSGEQVQAFLTSSVQFGQACVSQQRICQNGTLTGDYSFSSCSVGVASSCALDGKEVSHNGQTIAYQSSSVKYGESCVSETRNCNDGALSGSFTFKSCSVALPSSCTLGGTTVLHGEIIKAYPSSTVGVGQTCVSEDRLCQNGQLSGVNTSLNCTPLQACGSAHNKVTANKPVSGLCDNGTASAVSGNGTVSSPWSWSCNLSGTNYNCAASPCKKVALRIRSNSSATVNDPMRDIPFTGFAFALSGQNRLIGGNGTSVGTQMDTAGSYQEFRDAMNSGIAGESALNGRVLMSLGGNFAWTASDTSGVQLTGTELIMSTINASDSIQMDSGYWLTGGSSSGGGFGSSIVCLP